MIRNLLDGIPIALLVLFMLKEQIELQIILLTYYRSMLWAYSFEGQLF